MASLRAATVEEAIKRHSPARSRALHDKGRQNKEVVLITPPVAAALNAAAIIMEQDAGLPLLCDFTHPDPFAASTITARSDACLNEGWNGFGFWWIVPRPGATTAQDLDI